MTKPNTKTKYLSVRASHALADAVAAEAKAVGVSASRYVRCILIHEIKRERLRRSLLGLGRPPTVARPVEPSALSPVPIDPFDDVKKWGRRREWR